MDFTQQNQDALLQELNQFTRRTHTLDEVYITTGKYISYILN